MAEHARSLHACEERAVVLARLRTRCSNTTSKRRPTLQSSHASCITVVLVATTTFAASEGFQSVPDWTRPQLVCGGRPAMLRWRLVSRRVRVRGRSERCSSELGAGPWLRRARSVATRSTSAYQRVGRRRCSPGPRAEQAPCRCSCLPRGRPSPWRTSRAAWAGRLVGDPCAGRAGAARAARAAQPWRERGSPRAQAGVRPADRPRSGLGSCRTRRPAPARPGTRPQTDAIREPSGRHRTAARRFLSRSDLCYATALSPYHRASLAPSREWLDCETVTAAGRPLQFGRRGGRGVQARHGGGSCPSRPECESAPPRCPSWRARSRSSLRPTSRNTSRTAPTNPSDMSTVVSS